MKSTPFSLSGLVGALLCLGVCQTVANPRSPAAPATTPAAETVVTEADAGKTVRLHVGDTLTVRLESNVTTGYGWRTKERKGGSLVPVGKQPDYVPDPAPSGIVGSGGHDLFHFAVRKPGKETLGFVYVRPFKPGEVAKRARFEVVVQ